ncbi:MAG: endonuclease V [Phycisphaerae bacterium]|nr:endonuclease V [Phycisphaerae bacterium]
MKITLLHRWPTSVARAIALQRELAQRVRIEPSSMQTPRLFAGVDAAFSRDGRFALAAAVLWDALESKPLYIGLGRAPLRFPYIPGLLSFRELPAVLAALRKLPMTPDAVLCDAQGICHPRGIGLAAHLGLWLDLPTVGCAKSRLCGDAAEPPAHVGAAAPLMLHGEQVGVVLRTRRAVRPLFVSPGHRCDISQSVAWTLAACRGLRLPEPTRLAHHAVTRARG